MGKTIPLAVECEVCEIDKSQARDIVQKFHYLGDKPFRCVHAYGLRNKGNLVGAVVFHGVSAPETVVGAFGLARSDQAGFWEIGRLVLDPEYNGKNYGSFLLWAGIRKLKKVETVRAIITYADSALHSGGIYRASNFTYYGLTARKKDFYIEGKIQERGKTRGIAGEWRDRSRKHRYLRVFDRSLEVRWQKT